MAIERDWLVRLMRRLQDAVGTAAYLGAVDQGLDRIIARLGQYERCGVMTCAGLNNGLNLINDLKDKLERAGTVAQVRDAFAQADALIELIEEAEVAAREKQA